MKIFPTGSEILPMAIVALVVIFAVNRIAPLKAVVG